MFNRLLFLFCGKTMLTPLSYLENVPCNLDGFDIPQSLNADKIYCRISATISAYIFSKIFNNVFVNIKKRFKVKYRDVNSFILSFFL